MVGRALEALLQSAGYDTRLINDLAAGEPEELLQGVRLLLITPTVSAKSRDRFLAAIRSASGAASIPVLTLYTAGQTSPAGQTGLVPWPCRIADLKAAISVALLATSRAGASAILEESRTSPGRSKSADRSSTPGLGVQNPQFNSPDGRLGTIGDPELGDNVLHVDFGGSPADGQALGDLGVGPTLCQ